MVKLKGQMLSLEANGSIAKTLTFSTWKGRSYAKKLGKPTNNQQPTQLGVRAMLSFLASVWTSLSAAEKASWEDLATADQVSPFNSFLGHNLRRFSDGKSPTKEFPAAENAYDGNVLTPVPVTYPTFVQFPMVNQPGITPWLGFLYRSATTGFTPGPSNLVKAFLIYTAPTTIYIRDEPPSHGTWYYRYASANTDGTAKLMANELAVTF
jgi:hypothetical protein